jgi:tRNA dimethylallyltransferase
MKIRRELEKKSMEELTDILRGYKELHNVTDIDTKKRVIRAIEIEKYYTETGSKTTSFPEIKSLIIGVSFDRDSRRKRISERLKERLENGMVDEVKGLLDSGLKSEDLLYYGLEYKYITLYLTDWMSYDEMFSTLETEIHRFAKRQMTWFRGMERKGIKIHWIDGNLTMDQKMDQVLFLLKIIS